jgi:hypothetical protein
MNIKTQYLYLFIILLTLITSFFLKIDITNGGSSRDLFYHWNYIMAHKSNVGILFENNPSFKEYGAIPKHFPLHHVLASRFNFLTNNVNNYLNFYFIFSLFLPVLFYFCIENRFPEVEKNKKIFISSIIYFLPNYQASSIWGNSHITSLFFFLGSIYFLNNLEKVKGKNINLDIFFVAFFMACATYTRQYYAIFFPYLFFSLFRITKVKNIIFFCFVSLFLSIPGLFIVYRNPTLVSGFDAQLTDFKSSTLIVLSIIFVYLTPFFISNLKFNISEIKKILKNKNSLLIVLILSIIFFYFLLDFHYKSYVGGGLYFKISKMLLDGYLLFFTVSFFSLIVCFYYFKERLEDIILITLITSSFSYGWMIFHKYFEPMLIFCFFLLIKKDFIKKTFNFNHHIIFIYFLMYWTIYFLYSKQFIKKINLLLPPIGSIF